MTRIRKADTEKAEKVKGRIFNKLTDTCDEYIASVHTDGSTEKTSGQK